MNISRTIRPLPPIPQPSSSVAQRSLSLDVPEPPSSGSSTPSLSDDSQPPLEEHTLRSSLSLPIIPPSIVNVKFAPLPEIGPRKRKSNHPLGIGARSRMLQQRKEVTRVQGVYRQPRMWSDLDERSMMHTPDEAQEDDPLEVLGRLIADKSKSLWRRVASKAKPLDKHGAGGDGSEATTHEEDMANQPGSRTYEGALNPPDLHLPD
ncbi:hypothetical protein B0F90DRAFT_796236 [Multifurca ochricompacta]|uniref:Uncharacterized protein n=1 Tax=Multifurca ochricompacta TaxID=376703 RepID=A0AAD4MB87_9AGAM|nr:hypothetical protein B0F90DRAFT_796236 [Multifurca ochricompacta]